MNWATGWKASPIRTTSAAENAAKLAKPGHAHSGVAGLFLRNNRTGVSSGRRLDLQLSEFISGCLEQHYNAMLRSVDGLSGDEMQWMPTPECSSIGFLVWHYGRTLDRWVHSRLHSLPQLWEQGWAERLGQEVTDANETGYGYGPEQLQAFQTPDTSSLLAYAAATLEAAKGYLAERSDGDFDGKTVTNPRGGTMTLANMCQQLLWEFNQHGGQIAYLRGMQRGLEDSSYSGGLLEGLAAKEARNA